MFSNQRPDSAYTQIWNLINFASFIQPDSYMCNVPFREMIYNLNVLEPELNMTHRRTDAEPIEHTNRDGTTNTRNRIYIHRKVSEHRTESISTIYLSALQICSAIKRVFYFYLTSL